MLKLWSSSKVALSCYFLGVLSLQTGLVQAHPIRVSEAPDNNLALTLSAIQSAQQSLLVNIYEMTSPEIMSALQERIEAGVRVVILEEGQPVGGLSKEGRRVQSELVRAMKQKKNSADNHFYEMTSKASDQKRRFRFNHAKYIVTDAQTLLLGSENYSTSGNPRKGRIGNRGWQVFLRDREMVNQYQSVFHSDTDRSYGDMIDLTESHSESFFLEDSVLAKAFLEGVDYFSSFGTDSIDSPMKRIGKDADRVESPVVKKLLGDAPTDLDASAFQKITSPDTSLSGLTSMIENAQSSIDLELMSFNSRWGGQDEGSPLFQALLSAARRGVQIRILLNDEWVFARGGAKGKSPDADDFGFELRDSDVTPSRSKKKKQNEVTAELFNRIGADEGLKLSARIANVKKMGITYIHNKGGLVDDNKTLVSSINWNQNSTTNNREAALLITSEAVNAHYKALFDQDWAASE